MFKISRRDSLRYITLASIASGVLLKCTPEEEHAGHTHEHPAGSSGLTELSEEDKALLNQRFFTDEERETLRQLANLIIPADDRSGNAEEAGTVGFIEFMMLDQPQWQTPMRGGLRWLDNTSAQRFGSSFREATEAQQKELLDLIAFPDAAPPAYSQGVAFFNMARNFVATGFWTSEMGIADLQYMGNKATVWNGPPQEWLDRLGVQQLS